MCQSGDQSLPQKKVGEIIIFLPVESSTCSVLPSTLCSDESPWKHWNKTIRMLWLLLVLLSSQSVADVRKANVAHRATFYSGGTVKSVIPINVIKNKYGANTDLFQSQL